MAGEATRGAIRPRALRSVDRAVSRKRAIYEREVRDLIEAGFAVVRRTESIDPRVGEIVAESGLSNQAFYRHFRSKDELLLAMLEEGMRLLGGYLDHRMAKARTPGRRIRQFVAGLLEQGLNAEAARATRPFALSRGRLSELFPDDVKRSEAQLVGRLEAAIRDAKEAGELPDADPGPDAELVYGLAMSWLERKLADPAPTRRSEADHLIRFALAGLQRKED